MKAVRIHAAGDHHNLVHEDAPEPFAGTGDVVVRVGAAGFVPDELSWPSTWVDRAGRDRTPSTPAHEIAGTVAETPYGSTGFAVGDRVVGLGDWHRDGAAAEYVAVEARNLAVLPDSIDFTTAAALPIAGLTSLQGLFRHGGLRSGQRVVVHGAGGATGSLAVQLAREAGAHVIGTGRARAARLALDLGAHEFVDLEGQAVEDAVGAPVDLVFDTVGGDVSARSAALVAPGGTVVSITAPPVTPDGVRGVFFIVEPDGAQLAELVRRVDEGSLRVHVGATYPLESAAEAFDAKRRGVPGKVVLTL
ncbi:NADP-dependent oxidoreductase [Yinghuangia sp. YIM S09857]|uniref:NADP-dependent oxidoreductase n=1 Tax=Yinghuangia sp. YIM S09857 TaxID=3436929 RepID=UPI003F53076C